MEKRTERVIGREEKGMMNNYFVYIFLLLLLLLLILFG